MRGLYRRRPSARSCRRSWCLVSSPALGPDCQPLAGPAAVTRRLSLGCVHKMALTAAKSALTIVGIGAGAFVLRLLDHDAGWTESLSAIATVGATGAALFIATRDRADRKAEQLDADRAQARLVLLEVEGPYSSNGESTHHFIVCVADNGTQPILNVALESAQYVDGSQTVALLVPSEIVVPIVKPELAHGTFPAAFPTREATPTDVLDVEPNEYGEWPFPERLKTNVAATVQFTDAGGNRWRRSTAGLVELVEQA
jgi:hypothetical protein